MPLRWEEMTEKQKTHHTTVSRASDARKREQTYQGDCFLASYLDCGGNDMVVVGIAGQTLRAVTGKSRSCAVPIETTLALLQSGQFVTMCRKHERQYHMLQYWHLWTHEQLVEEMIRRMTPEPLTGGGEAD